MELGLFFFKERLRLVLQERREFPASDTGRRRLIMLEMLGGVRRPVKLNLLKAYISVKRLGRLL